MTNPFYNAGEERIRAGWRLLLQLAIMVLIITGLNYLVGLVLPNPGYLVTITLALIGFTGSIWISATYLDKRPFRSLGIDLDRRWFREFGVGFGIAALAMGFIFCVELASGWITLTGYGWERAFDIPYPLPLLGYLAGMLMVGFYEELFSRGYHIVNMTEGFSGGRLTLRQAAILALVVSSSIFGLLHAANPNAGVVSTVNIVIAGLALGIPYLVTGSLAIPAGLHAAWNFFQGGIFGFPVSGMPHRSTLLQIRETGPDLMTGGSFGPEAGLMGILGLVLMLLLLHLYARRAGYSLRLHESFRNETGG